MQRIVRKPKTKLTSADRAEEAPNEAAEAPAAVGAVAEEEPGVTEEDIPVELAPLENLEMKLTLTRDDNELASYTVSSLPLTIGRSKSADIRIKEDIAISRRHATIFIKEDAVYVYDRNSSNGLFSKGRRIRCKRLNEGDSFTLGGTEVLVELRKK